MRTLYILANGVAEDVSVSSLEIASKTAWSGRNPEIEVTESSSKNSSQNIEIPTHIHLPFQRVLLNIKPL